MSTVQEFFYFGPSGIHSSKFKVRAEVVSLD